MMHDFQFGNAGGVAFSVRIECSATSVEFWYNNQMIGSFTEPFANDQFFAARKVAWQFSNARHRDYQHCEWRGDEDDSWRYCEWRNTDGDVYVDRIAVASVIPDGMERRSLRRLVL